MRKYAKCIMHGLTPFFTKYGKYDDESYILGKDREGFFCEVNRYLPIWSNPVLIWRGKKEREVKEAFIIMTVKEGDKKSEYIIQVVPQKGIIKLIDKPENK